LGQSRSHSHRCKNGHAQQSHRESIEHLSISNPYILYLLM
jgi:hypothetical protein